MASEKVKHPERDDAMRSIELTQGRTVLVDDADFEYLNQWKWRFVADKRNPQYTGYALRNTMINGKETTVRMHRDITGVSKSHQVDHVNGNGLDNTRANLRICVGSQNQANRGKQKNCKSGFKGVSWNKSKRKWVSFIQVLGKHIYLGGFDCKINAARVYDEKAKEVFGGFARTNFNSALN